MNKSIFNIYAPLKQWYEIYLPINNTKRFYEILTYSWDSSNENIIIAKLSQGSPGKFNYVVSVYLVCTADCDIQPDIRKLQKLLRNAEIFGLWKSIHNYIRTILLLIFGILVMINYANLNCRQNMSEEGLKLFACLYTTQV